MFKSSIKNVIGNTPLIRLDPKRNIYAKFEGQNFFGSAKDRAASFIIEYLLNAKLINTSTEIIESSSGNFAIALAGICKFNNLNFKCVVDPLLNPVNEKILKVLGAELIMVSSPNTHNSYLQSRLNKVNEIVSKNPKAYWINQYDNPLIPKAYYGLADEIIQQTPKVNYVFVPVSTCGTISGISQVLKKYNSEIKIIAVDLDCSNIFYPAISEQHIPGMGLFKQPGNLKSAIIDDVVIVSEKDCYNGCKKLLDMGVFVGASSGGTLTAIMRYFNESLINETVVAIFPDKGERYINTIYDDDWCIKYLHL